MMKTIGLFAFGVLFMTSCVHHYYAPNAHNVPLLKEKNDLTVMAGLGSGDAYGSVEFQGAYAVSDRTGVMANAFLASGGDDEDGAVGNMVEVGVGRFERPKEKAVLGVYGGAGYFWQHHDYRDVVYKSTGYFFLHKPRVLRKGLVQRYTLVCHALCGVPGKGRRFLFFPRFSLINFSSVMSFLGSSMRPKLNKSNS